MKSFGPSPVIYDLNPFEDSSTQLHPLGAKGETADGRIFRYCKMGEAISMGYLTQANVIDTCHMNQVVEAASAIGDKEIQFTHGATTTGAGNMAGGFITVSYGTGVGQTLRVANNPAYTSGQTGCIITLEDPLIVALDTTSRIDLVPNPWFEVQMHTSQVTQLTGVALRAYDDTEFGWLQTRGVCGVMADNTITAGYAINNDANDAGKIDVSATNEFQRQDAGYAIQAGADGYVGPVYLTID